MKRRWFSPLGGLLVFVTWLVLNGSASRGHVAFALLLGLVVPALLGGLWPPDLVVRRPLLALRLLLTLLGDIVVANLQVAARILGPESALRPRFIWVPLTVRNRYAVSTFASMITLTPGTLSADVTADGRWLLVHALDVEDEAATVAELKRRYERPLAEILP
ncbi:MAG: Na+/H+ antiporter subunit E [Steroidobacteraceae bacterium]|jgi:multicomponent K+:H+ antiporter subunit E|nr:Na+/H+ antiporter subunit E [Steroidobacteraceae bacterium]